MAACFTTPLNHCPSKFTSTKSPTLKPGDSWHTCGTGKFATIQVTWLTRCVSSVTALVVSDGASPLVSSHESRTAFALVSHIVLGFILVADNKLLTSEANSLGTESLRSVCLRRHWTMLPIGTSLPATVRL